jgi:plasmid stabilization system protein ParE
VTYEVRLRDEADRDLTEAALWYELHGTGLGYQFLDEVLRALASIAENPFMYPVVWRETHRALMNRFPFGIFFRTRCSTIVVVAVMHGSRHPRNWMKRR